MIATCAKYQSRTENEREEREREGGARQREIRKVKYRGIVEGLKTCRLFLSISQRFRSEQKIGQRFRSEQATDT